MNEPLNCSGQGKDINVIGVKKEEKMFKSPGSNLRMGAICVNVIKIGISKYDA